MSISFFTHADNLLAGRIYPDSPNIGERLALVFNALKLPEPQEAEYLRGHGHGGVIFMHRAGLVLRAVNNNVFDLLRHPLVMRPIGSINITQDVRLDFQYAGRSPVTFDDAEKSEAVFESAGLDTSDVSDHNMCYLETGQHGETVRAPVLFDPLYLWPLTNKTIRSLSGSRREFVKAATFTMAHVYDAAAEQVTARSEMPSIVLDLKPLPGEEPDMQDMAYGDLRDKFRGMFDMPGGVGKIKVNPAAVDDFWRAVMAATSQGRLVPSWMDETPDKIVAERNIQSISKAYDARLAAYNPVFARD